MARTFSFLEADAAQALDHRLVLQRVGLRTALPRTNGVVLRQRVDLRFQLQRLGERRLPLFMVALEPQCSGEPIMNPPYSRVCRTRLDQEVYCLIDAVRQQVGPTD